MTGLYALRLDLPAQRLLVARLVVDAHVPAAEVVQVQFGVVEPLAESLARVADERNALIVLRLACALTQNIEMGANRPAGGYYGARRRPGHLDAADGTGGCRFRHLPLASVGGALALAYLTLSNNVIPITLICQ